MADPLEAGRLTAAALAHLKAYKDEVVTETAEALHRVDTAHLVMLCETGLIPVEIARVLLREMIAIESEGVATLRTAAGGGNHAGERLLSQRLGPDLGGHLGMARSSGDLSALSIRLYLRDAIEALLAASLSARSALLRFADAHRGTIMVGTTHGQHAQPTTLGHWAVMMETALARDCERLESLYDRVDRSPAGAGIMTGSDFAIDRERTAALLGFGAVLGNTMDAVLSHDIEMEYASVAAILAHTVGRFADDLMFWSLFEIGWISLPDWFCGTSSLMPQKKNPDGLEDFKSVSIEGMALISTVLATERGPTGYPILERRTSDAALRRFTARLTDRLALFPPLLAALGVDAVRAEREAGSNWAQAADLAALLVRTGGIDWRRAHGVIGGFIRHCADRQLSPRDIDPAMFRAAMIESGVAMGKTTDAEIRDTIDVRCCVERRQTLGGPASAIVASSIATSLRAIASATERLASRAARRDAAHAELDRVARLLADV